MNRKNGFAIAGIVFPTSFPTALTMLLVSCAVIMLLAGSQPAFSQTPQIYTVAGSGAGPGLQRMVAAVADSNGNVYVADGSFRVVKVSNPTETSPTFTVIAGTGVRGLTGDNGQAVSAQLQGPCGVALDAAEAYLYIADACGDPANGRVRRVELSTGLITFVAKGFNPQSIAVDSHNNVFVADGSDVYKIAAGVVTRFYSQAISGVYAYIVAIDSAASDTVYFSGFGNNGGVIVKVPNTNGTAGTPAKIAGADTGGTWNGNPVAPLAMNMDFSPVLVASGGYIYFNSQMDQRIGRFASNGSGSVELIAGNGTNAVTGDGGLAINAGIGNYDVYGMAVAGSNVFFGGDSAQLMRYFAVGGNINSVNTPGNPNYQGDNGPATSATISNNVMKVAFDASGNMYIADQANRAVRKVDGTTSTITTVVTGAQLDTGLAAGTHVGNFNITNDTAGNIYIATDMNGLFKLAGGSLSRVALPSAFSAVPLRDIAFNAVDNFIYVIANSNVDKIKTDGTGHSVAYSGAGVTRLSLAVDKLGNVWATQASGSMLNTLSLDQLPATGTHILADIGAKAVATYPVAGDPRGGVVYMDNFVAKSLNSGATTTIAGQPGTDGFSGDNGPAVNSTLSSALGLAFDPYCNLYISDSENQRIRKVENLITATVGTNQSGLDITVDGVDGGGSFTWVSGTTHTLSTTSPQTVAGTKYIFTQWSLPGNQTDTSISTTKRAGCSSGTYNAMFITPPTMAANFGADQIPVNNTTSLSFTINNPNTSNALTGVNFTDALPSGLKVASPNGLTGSCGSGTITAAAGSSSVSLSGATLAASGSCTFSVSVTGVSDGIQNNTTGSISSTETGAGNTASASITVINPPTISQVFGASSLSVNATTSLTFTLTSSNVNLTLNGVAFTDDLPTGLVVATPGNLNSSCGGTATAADGASSVTLSGETLAPSATCTIRVNVIGTGAGPKSNSVQATSTNGGTGNTSTAGVTVAVLTPSVTVTASPASPSPVNSAVTFTASLTGVTLTPIGPSGTFKFLENTSPMTPITECMSVAVTSAGVATCTVSSSSLHSLTWLSTGTYNITAMYLGDPNYAGAQGSTSYTVTPQTPTVTLTASPSGSAPVNSPVSFTASLTGVTASATYYPSGQFTFAANGTAIPSCSVAVNSAGVATCGTASLPAGVNSITATYSSDSSFVASLPGSTSYTIVGPPVISETFNPAQIPLNGTTSLQFTITNPTVNTTALSGVAFVDTLPTGLTVASASASVCGGTLTTTAPRGITLSGATIAASGQCQFSVTVTGATAGAHTNTTGVVTSTEGGSGNTATANLTVIAPPSIAKTFNPAAIALNTTTSLQFTITNPAANTVPLTGLAFTDLLPTGLTVANASATVCGGTLTTTSPTGISLTGAMIAVNSQCQFSVTVTGTTAGSYTNITGAVSSTNGGTGNTATANLTVVAPPSIAKTFNPATIALNATTSLTFTITNPAANTVPLAGLAFTDTLPTGLTVANASTTVCGGMLITTNPTAISLVGATIAVNSQCQFSVTVTGAASGQYTSMTGAVSSTNGGTGNNATANLTVASPPTVTQVFGAATIPLNGTTLLTFTIQNPNTSLALTGIAFSDNLPAGLVIASTPNLNNTCGGTATALGGSGSVSLSAVTLTANASCTVSVNVTGTTAGVKSNSVQVSSTEGGTGNTSNRSITVVAPPSIAAVFGAASIPLNGSTSLSFTLNNTNTTTALTGVSFSNTLPAGLVIATPIAGSCGSGTIAATPGANVISLSGGSLAASGSCTFSLNVTGTAAGLQNNATSSVASTEGGTGAPASASLAVVAPPSIAKAFNPSTIALNATTSLTLTITNPAANTVSLTGVAFTDTLPTGLTVANASATVCGGTLTTTAPTGITLSGASIAANGQCQVSVTVTGAASGQYTNTTGAVSSTNGGTGNTATANLTVASPPSISTVFGAATIPLNGTTLLTFTIQNPNANIALTGLAFADNLPAGLVIASTPNLNNTCGGTAPAVAGSGSVSLSAGTLAASASCTVSVNVTGTTAGVKNNGVQVMSTEGGTGNTSNPSITVVAPPVIAEAFGAASIPLNGSTSLSFTLNNPNTTTALAGVSFSNTLPAGLVIATPNGLTGSCGSGTITATAGTSVISLSGGTLLASGTCTFSLNVKGTAAGTQNDTTGNVTSTEGGTGATASASVKVVAPPSIAKTFNPATVALNGTTSLTFTITNPAANTVSLTGVSVSDSLPAGLSVADSNSTVCGGALITMAPSEIALSIATIATNSQCQFSVTVTGTASGQYSSTTGTVSSVNGGIGNTASATLTVASPPTVTQVFGAANIPTTGTTSLTLNITNPNSGLALTGLAFTDNLPAGLVIASTANLANTCGGAATATSGSTSISLSAGALATNASCTVSVNVEGTTAGVKNNSVQVSSTEGGTGSTANASLAVVGPPTISKVFGAPSIPLNGTTSLSFTVNNANTTVTLTGISFTDTLLAGLVVSTPNALTGSCGSGAITAPPGASVISLSGASVAASGSCSFSVNVTGTTAGTKDNTTGTIASTEGGTGGTASASIVVVAPPVIAKVFSPSAVLPGTSVALNFTITNPSVNTVALTGVAFTDMLPSTLTVVDGSSSVCGGTLFRSDNFPDPNIISLSGATIAPNASCQFSVTLGTTQAGQFFNATSPVTSTNGGTGNSASASLIAAFPPVIANAFGAATIPLNGATSLTFTITNPALNLTPVNGVTFNDVLPAGLVIAAPSNLSSTCGGTLNASSGSSSVSLSGGTLAVGGACTISLNVQGTTAGAKNNTTGAVSATESGTGVPSNTATLMVLAPPMIADSFGAPSIALGGSASLTFEISNPNPGYSVTGVAFTNVLPTGLVVATPNGVTGSCGAGTITAVAGTSSLNLAGATLVGSGSCMFSVNVLGVHAGTQTNTTGNVASLEGGTGGTATASLTVNQASTTTTVVTAGSKHFGETATFTATVTSPAWTPTGSVAFLDGTTTLGTATLSSGVATFNTSSLALGTHSITAQYQGNSDYLGSVSAPVSQDVTIPAITVNAGTTSLTVTVGQSGTTQLTIGSAGTLSAAVTLSCSGLPVGSQCVFSPASVGPGNLPAQATLTVTTTRLKIVGQNTPSRLPWTFAVLLPGFCLLSLAGKGGKRRWLSVALGLVVLLALMLCAGCGGGSPNSGITNVQQSTTPGTYAVTVTATSTGATPSSMNLNLVVTP